MLENSFSSSAPFIEFKPEEIEQSIPERFEKIVQQYPDKIAIKGKDAEVTYSELNAMANRFAHALVGARGTEPEVVGLVFEKGITQIAAILGVLKAGKFLVLLDPSFPADRLVTIVDDCRPAMVWTDRVSGSIASSALSRRCIVRDIESIDRGLPSGDLKLPISPTALAALTYTSGSTGQPKGVIWNHQHRLHCHMIRTQSDRVSAEDRLALLFSGTSNTITNAFVALLNGSLLLPFDVKKEGAGKLAYWLSKERVTICVIAPPLFRTLCETLRGNDNFPDLRIMRSGSAAVYKRDIELFRSRFASHCLFVNSLSASETGMLTRYVIDRETEIQGNEIPIGYPVQDKEILLMDDDGKEVGIGEVGEIVVRSKYLSPGYWNDPELTAAKFKPDPKGSEKRLYYTGDLGLRLPDGCLIHRGRKDFRAKVRGYRVDLTEVQKALLSHNGVKDAVVVAPETETGDARLIGYFTCRSEPGPTIRDLRSFLKEKLTDYMVPSLFVKLSAFPLTTNGKIDRKALPVPDESRPELSVPYESPRNDCETNLVEIWEAVLKVRPVGIHDDFLELGGHSLLASRIVAQVNQTFGIDLSLSSLLEVSTVAGLAGVVASLRSSKNPSAAKAMNAANEESGEL
jgi:amino acid adenylation domain-containing protein